MKNKYYTPSLEEFYSGFEYEQISIDHNSGDRNFNKTIFRTDMFASLPLLIHGKFIQCKYLDQEDIEELGWILQDKKGPNMELWFEIAPENYGFNDYEKWILLVPTFGLESPCTGNITIKHKLETSYQNINDTLSYITIKNKSELKRLMNWLNIKTNDK